MVEDSTEKVRQGRGLDLGKGRDQPGRGWTERKETTLTWQDLEEGWDLESVREESLGKEWGSERGEV